MGVINIRRNRRSQSKHDREVSRIARSYRRRGYKVRADNVPNFSDPAKGIGGYVPDVVAKKNGHTTVVEVETPDSVNTKRDRGQRRAFKRWANYKKSRHFRKKIID